MTDQAAEQTTTGGISDRIVFLVLGSLLTLAIIVSLIAFFDFGRWWVFGNPNFAPWLDGFFQNAGTEFLGALLTFYLIETLLRKRRGDDERKDREKLQREVAKEIRDELRKYIQAQELARLRAAETPEARQPILISMSVTGLLQGAYLESANLEEANLREAKLEGADLRKAKLEGADLRKAKLEGSDLREANLEGAVLEKANLEGASLWRANLQGANLRRANLEEVVLWDANLEGASLVYAKLQGAGLHRAKLERANLSDAKLEGTDLRRAKLEGAELYEANLQGANLEDAKLEGANLWRANLQGALFLTVDQLRSAETLQGTTLPDGTQLPNVYTWQQAFEDWVENTAQFKEIDRRSLKVTYIVPTRTEANAFLWDHYYGDGE